ncbi:MAG: sigma 54-interacting transcriptional regulator [Candidatus Cloacimonetes bacterium]|nr:sigma 54-interacting transcriptional regulator [Candidatus Cloacimonadota bacterium]
MKKNRTNMIINFLNEQPAKILYCDPNCTESRNIKSESLVIERENLIIKLQSYLWDIIIFDIFEKDDINIFKIYKEKHPRTKLVFFSEKEDFNIILSAYQINIDLYLPKLGININYFRCAIELLQEDYSRIIISKNSQLQQMYEFLRFYATKIRSDILITGENGTGKGIIAKAISIIGYMNKPFVVQNCAGIPDTLFESEMFGYEQGAFTGASIKGKIGVIEKADQGLLFLDEIGELPMNQQAKLLRAIQRKVILRVGSSQEKKVNVRFIFATNKKLYEEVQQKNFREDFFYRIKGAEIDIPPLRETKDDIEIMIAVFTARFIKEQSFRQDFSEIILNKKSLEYLKEYNFPGNMRELQKIVYQSLISMLINNSNELTLISPVQIIDNKLEKPDSEVETFWQIIELLENNLIKYRGLTDIFKKPILDHLRTKYNDNRKKIASILGFQDKQTLANEIYRINKKKFPQVNID